MSEHDGSMDGLRPRPEVPPTSLASIARLLGGPAEGRHAEVTGITHDSRYVRAGDLYAALPGSRHHGAEFVGAAAAAGAAAVLTDASGRERAEATGLPVVVVDDPRGRLGEVAAEIYRHPCDSLLVIGITGTNGKTTTAYLVDAALKAAGHRTGLVGTVETRIDDQVIPSTRTTPEATDLQALLAVMRDRGCTAVVMEVSSHALALGRVAGMTYDVAVFTNLSQDHLDFHADLEDYFTAKASLFTKEHARSAVVDVDDSYGARLAKLTELPVTTLSTRGAAADWQATQIRSAPQGSQFVLTGPAGVNVEAAVKLAGAFNVANAAAALVSLATAGVSLDDAVQGVASLPGVPGRMEPVVAGQPFLAVVDYAHTPDAVETLLLAVREVTEGRVLIVLGCGGDRDAGKRPLMGAAAARLADVAVLTNDNPRSEDPLAILDAMQAGVADVPEGERGEVLVEPDRAAAIRLAVRMAGPADAVVVAGKGHEQGQELREVVRPFDDRAALRQALVAVGGTA